MTNRARPTWPEGADSSKSQRPAPGGKQSTPATPASNGRSGSAPSGNGQRPAAELRPQQQRPGTAGAPARPAQQPPVRPVTQPGTGRSTQTPSTPSRPEPWSPTTPGGGKPTTGKPSDGESSYGVTGRT